MESATGSGPARGGGGGCPAAVLSAAQILPVFGAERAEDRLQGRSSAAALCLRARQDRAEPHHGRLDAAAARAGAGNQAGALSRSASLHGEVGCRRAGPTGLRGGANNGPPSSGGGRRRFRCRRRADVCCGHARHARRADPGLSDAVAAVRGRVVARGRCGGSRRRHRLAGPPGGERPARRRAVRGPQCGPGRTAGAAGFIGASARRRRSMPGIRRAC